MHERRTAVSRSSTRKAKAGPLPHANGGWAAEISIDVQMAHAICQSCRILLVEAKSEEFADLGAGVECGGRGRRDRRQQLLRRSRAPVLHDDRATDYEPSGRPVLASSGDCGYLNKDCAGIAAGAEFPADAPGVIAVGGTSLSETPASGRSTAWEEGGSGCSKVFDAEPWQSGTAGASRRPAAASGAPSRTSPRSAIRTQASTSMTRRPKNRARPTGWGVWGGTSVASPIVAGEFALAGGGFGVADPAATLYAHFGQASALYDVTSGSDGECAARTICHAAAGFDGPTGVGSPVGLEAFAIGGTPESVSPPDDLAASPSRAPR